MGQNDSGQIDELLARVRENIVRNYDLSSEDPALANLAYYAFVESAREIRRITGSLLPLKVLLRDDDPRVRCAIGTCLLWLIPEEAMPVLQEVATHEDLTAVRAEIVIRKWRAGTLKPHI